MNWFDSEREEVIGWRPRENGRLRKRRLTAEAAVDLAKRHLVQPWPLAGSIGAEARSFIGEGEGIYITDGEGRRLIDGPAGMWCVNVGHRRRELAEVMAEQAMALSYNTPWYTMNAPSAVLAERLAAHAPGDLDHVFFTTGGSSAVETALRFMQFYNNVRGRPEKKLIVSRGGAYHGSTYLSASLNGRPRDRDWMDAADELVVKLSSPDPFRRPAGMSLEAFSAFLVGEFEDDGGAPRRRAHRRLRRRADPGLGWRHRAAAGLSGRHPQGLPRQ